MAVKYHTVASAIAEMIRDGQVADGDRLPSEADLAETYNVSRATIRNALSLLQADGLVETWNGSGSFVRFRGEDLTQGQGWTSSLEHRGVHTATRLLSFGRVALPEIAADLELSSPFFLLTERVRLADGVPVSLERSRAPWRPGYQAAVDAGVLTGSLQDVLNAAGVQAVRYSETVTVGTLGQDEADHLGARVGDAFLRTELHSFDAGDHLTEQVVSLLSPAHFTITREGRL